MRQWILPVIFAMAAVPAGAAQPSGGSGDLPFQCDANTCICKGPKSSGACTEMASSCAGEITCKADGVCACASAETAFPPGYLGGPARRGADRRILPPPKQE